jgi:hypothetical protein
LVYKIKKVGCCFTTTKDTIMSMYPEGAAKTISEYDYGVHCLLIYTDLSILREFYSHYIPERIEGKEQVVQIMPFYETEESVRQTLSKAYSVINREKVENEEKSLIKILWENIIFKKMQKLPGMPIKRRLNTLVDWKKRNLCYGRYRFFSF